jgi:predicted aldo/keto reductase-like oxidoreductase
MSILKRKLGRTGVDVSILGLGGEGVLRTFGYDSEAVELINRAIDGGINYFESARAYSGSESYYGKALKGRRKQIFLTSKSHARDIKGAQEHLYETLSNMKTDYLDLWQVHDVRTEEEINEIFGPRGAIHAFIEAKEKGQARFIGVTGHHDPIILKKCIQLFDFDTVLMPVNPAEPHYKCFIDDVIPLAQEKEMGIVGMKVYLRGLVNQIPGFTTPEPFFRFALSQPLSLITLGCDNCKQLEENISYACTFIQMTEDEQQWLINTFALSARKFMYYKP